MGKHEYFIHHGDLGWISFGRKLDADAADGVDVMRMSVRPYHARHLEIIRMGSSLFPLTTTP